VLQQSRPLDQVGVFARTIEDAALVAEQMMAYDDRDPDTQMQARPALQKTAAEEPPVSPRLAFVKSPVWDQADEDTKEAFAELVAHLGENAGGFELPDMFQEAVSLHRTIMEADLARSFEQEYARGKKRLSPILREMIERGQKVLAVEYNRALSQIPVFRHELDKVFEWPSGWNRREARYFAPYGPFAGCPRSPFPYCRVLTACRWVYSW
jgi:Asp-tRNA(Asn)/Glu-tRNA(Gln) amidotransferase A subunit family amidase